MNSLIFFLVARSNMTFVNYLYSYFFYLWKENYTERFFEFMRRRDQARREVTNKLSYFANSHVRKKRTREMKFILFFFSSSISSLSSSSCVPPKRDLCWLLWILWKSKLEREMRWDCSRTFCDVFIVVKWYLILLPLTEYAWFSSIIIFRMSKAEIEFLSSASLHKK